MCLWNTCVSVVAATLCNGKGCSWNSLDPFIDCIAPGWAYLHAVFGRGGPRPESRGHSYSGVELPEQPVEGVGAKCPYWSADVKLSSKKIAYLYYITPVQIYLTILI